MHGRHAPLVVGPIQRVASRLLGGRQQVAVAEPHELAGGHPHTLLGQGLESGEPRILTFDAQDAVPTHGQRLQRNKLVRLPAQRNLRGDPVINGD